MKGSLNPERDAEILRRWELRESSVTIAAALRVTRNTVLGVVCRAGKQRGDKANSAQREGGRKASVRMKPNRTITMRALKARQREQAAVEAYAIEPEVDPSQEIPIGQRCTILDLTDSKCRWPIGDPGQPDFFFCGGRAIESLPYCGYHARVAYRPRESAK